MLQQMEREATVEKFVDKYFLPHFYHHLQRQHHSGSCTLKSDCNLCAKLEGLEMQPPSYRRQMLLNQDDIDLLELMDPKTTPQTYMRSILRLYRREQNLRPREDANEPMQLALTTRKLLHQGRIPRLCVPGLIREDDPNDQEQTRQEQLDRAQISRLRDECYLGLGRMIVERREIQKRHGLGNTNYHTRQYLLPQVQEEVQRRAATEAGKGERKFYLLANANSRGISFPVDHMPPNLSHVLEFDRFREVVCTLNAIIQQTAYQHRSETSQARKMSGVYFWQWVWLMVLVSVLIVNRVTVQSEGRLWGYQALTNVCLVGALCLMVFILMVSCHRFQQQHIFVSLVDRLNLKITDYLNYLNSRPDSKLYWKTQERLYWIQITINKDPQ